MKVTSAPAAEFVEAVQPIADAYYASRFGSISAPPTFSAIPGVKFDKIVAEHDHGGASVHCFVDADGNVYKAATWRAPAKGVRYTSVAAAIDEIAADPRNIHGSYLYAGYTSAVAA